MEEGGKWDAKACLVGWPGYGESVLEQLISTYFIIFLWISSFFFGFGEVKTNLQMSLGEPRLAEFWVRISTRPQPGDKVKLSKAVLTMHRSFISCEAYKQFDGEDGCLKPGLDSRL